MATTMFIHHQVADYSKWREVYEAYRDEQQEGGVVDETVYRSAADPSDITVTHEFATLELAQAFANNPDLKAAMTEAGVIGVPTIWFGNKA
jgi:hypothetical protein